MRAVHTYQDNSASLYAIVDILFTRGEGVSDEQFAKGIDHAKLFGLLNQYIVTKLDPFASSADLKLRIAACKQLSYYGKPCN